MTRSLVKTSVVSIVLKSCGALLSILVTASLARLLGVEGFGSYAYVLAVLTLLALPAQAGLPQLVTRETAMGLVAGDSEKILGLWKWAGSIAIAVGALVIVILGVINIMHTDIIGEFRSIFLAGMAVPLLLAVANVRAGALRGLKKVIYALLTDSIVSPVMFLVLALLFFLSGEKITPPKAMVMNTISLTAAFIVGAVILRIHRPWGKSVKTMVPKYEAKSWFAALIPLSMIQGFRLINSKADILMLGVMASMLDVGIFKAMMALSASLLLSIEAINGVIAPYVAACHQKQRSKDIEFVAVGAALASFLLMLVPASVFLVWGRDLISLIYGSDYAAGYVALLVILLGHLVNAAVGPVALLLNMTGNESFTMKGVGGSTVLNILLNFALIPQYGMVGAAIASVVTMIGWNFLLLYYVNKKLGFNSSVISKILIRDEFWGRIGNRI